MSAQARDTFFRVLAEALRKGVPEPQARYLAHLASQKPKKGATK